MNTKEKIAKLRQMYITAHGQEPRSLIIGYLAVSKIDNAAEYLGMKVYVDYDKDNRVEVGNIAAVQK